LLTSQSQSIVPTKQILNDTAPGGPGLPSFSIVLPNGVDTHGRYAKTSQHNGSLMSVGDNWIGQVVSAIQGDTKDWSSTAIFITWDDCGCFYDHVPSSVGSGFGIRVPMVIVSPYARRGYTERTTASFASMLRFTERVFSVPPLASADASAYDYFGSFNFAAQPNLATSHLIQQPVSPAPEQQVQAIKDNPNDPA
jgi:phospholipase C